MRVIFWFLRAFAANESGATAIEYGLIISLIFVAIVASAQPVADATIAMYNMISSQVSSNM